MSSLIGITGKKQSGKSTLASRYVTELGYVELAFADPLKSIISTLFDISYDQLNDGIHKETVDSRYNVTPRQLLQTVGTALFRDKLSEVLPNITYPYGNNIWISHTMYIAKTLISQGYKVVISDVRFNDEAQSIIDNGGIVLRINGGNNTDGHISEQGIDNSLVTYTVDRNDPLTTV